MSTLILTRADVRELLEMEACIECVADSLRVLSSGSAQNPLRWPMFLADDAARNKRILGLMPGSMDVPSAVGLKVVTVYPGNHGTAYDSHQGIVALFDPERGSPIAILDGGEITAVRTAAASAVATRELARPDASELAILGSGVQAMQHVEAMRAVRPIERVRVFSPNAENRNAFAARESRRHGIPIVATESAESAVAGADIVCTTTSSNEPVLEGAWLGAGAHVNAVGACTRNARELDADAVRNARVFVDCLESAENEAGDLLIPGLADSVVGELGALLLGRLDGRRTPDEITLFESLGVAVEDLATAVHLMELAQSRNVGLSVELGGPRDA